MKKGFTLIELLAVIVILAIIALIATPIILGIINDARDEAKQRSAELVVQSVELAYSTSYMLKDGRVPTVAEVKAQFDMDGATWDLTTSKITTEDDVTCTVTSGTTLSVSCDAGNAATSTTMSLATQ